MAWLRGGKYVLQAMVLSPEGNLRVPIAIGLGAIAGALSRYYLSLGINQWLGTVFPFATFFINLSGAFVMGFFTSMAIARNVISPDIRLIIAVGFLGSYTTFSTYTLDLERLIETGNWQSATLYWIGSTVLGVLSLELGRYIAQKLP
ncbi:fluoride efflux transporter CrcB [Leptolyngbya ohadii]|uniref:fluoride efflux transporter CrcB n=1 Tax=Leptolyngbya ohadii TaxID=1962290 RepID=UPI001CED172C|nr:fluoride efflux transporter CrcB [Leptolyngbya ohadii]